MPSGPRLLLAHFAMPAPIDAIYLVSDGTRLLGLDFTLDRLTRLLRPRFGNVVTFIEGDNPNGFSSAILAYFAGRFDALDALPIDGGGSPFQLRVWSLLRAIPPGETRTYGQLAAALGQPGAARAVGLANGSNPINIVVPCHRVIGSGGALTGYGGGLDRKRWLLDLERRTVTPPGELAFF